MKIKETMNKGLCELSNKVIGSGISLFTGGEQEIPDSLKEGYEKMKKSDEEGDAIEEN